MHNKNKYETILNNHLFFNFFSSKDKKMYIKFCIYKKFSYLCDNKIKNTIYMKQEFIICKSRYEAYKVCPWAARTMKVKDGYICFESIYDYETAKKQK